jgi:hypothetical protein
MFLQNKPRIDAPPRLELGAANSPDTNDRSTSATRSSLLIRPTCRFGTIRTLGRPAIGKIVSCRNRRCFTIAEHISMIIQAIESDTELSRINSCIPKHAASMPACVQAFFARVRHDDAGLRPNERFLIGSDCKGMKLQRQQGAKNRGMRYSR